MHKLRKPQEEESVKIISTRAIHGPNVYHHRPVIVMKVDLQEWAEVPSNQIPSFNENLVQFLPNLNAHTCSLGCEGGFLERLRRGTYMAHIIEHIGLELSNLAGMEVNYGKTRYAGQPGHYNIVTRFIHERAMQLCLQQAMELAKAAIHSSHFDVNKVLHEIKEEMVREKLGPSTEALVQAAIRKNIPYRRIGDGSLLQLGYGKNIQRVMTAVTGKTGLISSDIAQDKELTKKVLQEHFLPVPEGIVARSLEEVHEAMKQISPPYVVKPFNGNHGNGVSLNLYSDFDVAEAFEIAREFSRCVLLEEMCEGRDYRLLIINGELIAAAERIPPSVVGDGHLTIQQLINELNKDPRRGRGHESVLTLIEVDEIMLSHLKKQDLSLESVPAKNQKVALRQNANLSSGGSAHDVTDLVHPDIKSMGERAARAIGLDICGIDLIAQDISQPLNKSVKIIEVNAGPGLRMHLAPSSGVTRPVGDKIIEMLYPSNRPSRIPIVSVTGTNGKTTVVRMLHKIFSQQLDLCVGMTTTDGVWIGTQKIYAGDMTGPRSCQSVLSDPKVDVAVLEIARGGLLRGGLAYDWSDVSVITNIREDHIGQDGIEDVDDLVWIKSLIAERVRENGTLVLNADDEKSLNVRNNPRVLEKPRNIFLFSISSHNPVLREHVAKGLSACWVENEHIFIQHKNLKGRLLKLNSIPASLNGLAEFQTSNALASLAASLAAEVPLMQALKGLQEFTPAYENLGRMNIYKIKQGYVILDYGHNGNALQSMGKMLSRLKGYSKTAVVSLPGDRSDDLIAATGRTVSKFFDQFVVKEDKDLRGRASGEVPKLLCKAMHNERPNLPCHVALDETEAVTYALEKMQPNEIITIFYEKLEETLRALHAYDPEPVFFIPEIPIESMVEKKIARAHQPETSYANLPV